MKETTTTNKEVLMNWKDLLSDERLNKRFTTLDDSDSEKFNRFVVDCFTEDYDLIINSAAFRRLQDKTQVFPLEQCDYIRTRLTHSLEVSSIARQLGLSLLNDKENSFLSNLSEDEDKMRLRRDIPQVLACAGLLHDLGNPPFGHFGEDAIRNWFRQNLKKIEFKDSTIEGTLRKHPNGEQMVRDLENFEGNAQTLRILVKAKKQREKINVSYAVISTLMKYTCNSVDFDANSEIKFKKKLGYFLAEEQIIREISETVGTLSEETINRHPLSYLLEAADDMAYLTSDLQDAFKKKLIHPKDFLDFYAKKTDEIQHRDKKDDFHLKCTRDLLNKLKNLETKHRLSYDTVGSWINEVRFWLQFCVMFNFREHVIHDESIPDKSYASDMFEGSNQEYTIEILKEAMKEFVYEHDSIVRLECSANTVISFLLDNFIKAAIYSDDKEPNKMTEIDQKYVNLISEDIKDYYTKTRKNEDGDEAETYNLYLRILMVTDFISGMTDSYARSLYRELSTMS